MHAQSLAGRRQIHLDFHTSPLIPDVGSEFDARAFATRLRAAHVDSVTVFAKCHHGQCYFPTRTGTTHPALAGRDLLGEQLEALRSAGIRCPIYTTIAWEEDVAARFPAWRMLRADGRFARCGNPDLGAPGQPGGWWFMNFIHPDYQDYIEAHVREIVSRYGAVDGFFFDIVFVEERSCWSDASVAFRERHGLLGEDAVTQARFESAAQLAFAQRFTALVRGLVPTATVFYNSTNPVFADSRLGIRSRHAEQTHWELESLPSGFWGYHHFPRLARAVSSWGLPWLGMTGRFQRMWGDFGGIKPQAALEYECFRIQALGGAISVGDQLPPRGRLDEGAYRLIGAVYAQVATAERFYQDSVAWPQVGIVAPLAAGADLRAADLSLEGAVQLCEAAHYDAVVLDDAGDPAGLDAVILPDVVELTPELQRRLQAYLAAGGRLLLSDRSAFAADGTNLLGLPLHRRGAERMQPTYWRGEPAFDAGLALGDRVVYQPGSLVDAGPRTTVPVRRVHPYFRRTDLTYCSHFQAPPRAEATPWPAVVTGTNFAYFADPVFREWRQHGNIAVRDGCRAALRALAGPPRCGDGLPADVLCVPRRRGDDLIVTLLRYTPTRTSIDIDLIEEPGRFGGEILRLPTTAQAARLHGRTAPLPWRDGGVELPTASGRLLIECPGALG